MQNKADSGSWITPTVRLWALRMLVPLRGHQSLVLKGGFRHDGIADALRITGSDGDDGPFDHRKALAHLKQMHRVAERKAVHTRSPQQLVDNLARLRELAGLSDTDVKLLDFAVTVHTSRLLDDTGDLLGAMSLARLIESLSLVLDEPEALIRTSLAPRGMLAQSGLLTIDHNSLPLRAKLDLISGSFADTIRSLDIDADSLLRGLVNPASAPHLQLTDYGHIEESTRILIPYLARSSESARTGVNILLHGEPGTGKNQFAAIMARIAGCELFEVASEDFHGRPIEPDDRLRAYRAAQSFFARRRAMVLFDEIEDVFSDGLSAPAFFGGRKSTARNRKAWVNRVLECNPLPAFWLSNSIERLDPAFLRRFDMVIELPIPPRPQRLQIVQGACGELLPAEAIARIADAEALAPAVLTRAAAVVRSIREDLGPAHSAAAIEHLLNATLKAQGHKPTERHDPTRLPETYDPAFIHADCDLAAVADGLLHARGGRLCLYGPPGTGKTAFGRWMAERLGMPLLVKRGSDLMSMWVGGTEKNIAQAFEQARSARALLLIDEVDSFLQDRRQAQRSWEVTQVNEMLTQMEAFPGVFIATTNLMDGLDQASLRRFDLKVKFGYLDQQQSTRLFVRYARQLGIPVNEQEDLLRLRRLVNLTPGDFAAVIRQSRFRPIASTATLVAALEGECRVKEPAVRPIGFTA